MLLFWGKFERKLGLKFNAVGKGVLVCWFGNGWGDLVAPVLLLTEVVSWLNPGWTCKLLIELKSFYFPLWLWLDYWTTWSPKNIISILLFLLISASSSISFDSWSFNYSIFCFISWISLFLSWFWGFFNFLIYNFIFRFLFIHYFYSEIRSFTFYFNKSSAFFYSVSFTFLLFSSFIISIFFSLFYFFSNSSKLSLSESWFSSTSSSYSRFSN